MNEDNKNAGRQASQPSTIYTYVQVQVIDHDTAMKECYKRMH